MYLFEIINGQYLNLNILTSRTKHIKKAVQILKDKNVDFDFDGDMQPDVALNEEYKELYIGYGALHQL